MLVGITYTPFLIRMLGQSEYGLYSIVYSVISYLTVMDMGFGNAIVIYTARYINQGNKEKQDKLHGMFMVIYHSRTHLTAPLVQNAACRNGDYTVFGEIYNLIVKNSSARTRIRQRSFIDTAD